MYWLVFVAFMVVGDALKDIFSKHSLRQANEYAMAVSMKLLVAVLLLPVILYAGEAIRDDRFWPTLLVCAVLNAVATILYLKALKVGDLSLVMPMVAVVPLLILGIAPLLLGEVPSPIGVVSIVFVVIGSYILQIKERRRGYLAPLAALFREKGTRYMLGVAVLWSMTSVIDKMGVTYSSPLVWVFALNLAVGIAILPVLANKIQKEKSAVMHTLIPVWPFVVLVAVFSMLTLLFQMNAIQYTQVAYVLSFKRLSILLSVLAGFVIFRERYIQERFVGALCMVVGVILLVLFV